MFLNSKILFEVSNFMSSSYKEIIPSEKCREQTCGQRAEEEGGMDCERH